jgi:hypothetical protein
LDSSLIAAFLSERDTGSLTKKQLRKLRRTLAKLATGASHDEQLISEALLGTHIDGRSISSGARSHESTSAPSTVTDASSPLASICITSFSSLLGFLQAVFPEIPPARLERVITDASFDGGFVDGVDVEQDVERIIQLLLTQEYPEDPGEVGGTFGGLENKLSLMSRGEGQVVHAKRKRKKRLKTIPLSDIRQKQHVDEGASGSPHGSRFILPSKSSDVDIWTSVSSISAQLATLLHPYSESFFKSFFHSPESKTPAIAVRHALTAIINSRDEDVSSPDMTVLLNLQDILRSTSKYNELNEQEQKRLFLDAHLCLQAVGSQIDNALDLVWLLYSLGADDAAGWKVAPYHQEPLPNQDNCIMETSKNVAQLWPRLPFRPQDDWNVVSCRKRPTAKRHSGSILTSDDSHGASTRQIGFAKDKGPAGLKERHDDLQTRIREASMSAARAWKGGNSKKGGSLKNAGRQVAMYHVEEVRTFFRAWLTVSAEDRSRLRRTTLFRCADYRKS